MDGILLILVLLVSHCRTSHRPALIGVWVALAELLQRVSVLLLQSRDEAKIITLGRLPHSSPLLAQVTQEDKSDVDTNTHTGLQD